MAGLLCDVCKSEIKNLWFLRTCIECHRILCSGCIRRFYYHSTKINGPRWQKFTLKYEEVCNDCYEKLEEERLEEESKIEDEKEPPKPITKCELCTATDEPPERKTFGDRKPHFTRCDRCGRNVCDLCIIDIYNPRYDYDLICRKCYNEIEEEEAREREEIWRKREEEEE